MKKRNKNKFSSLIAVMIIFSFTTVIGYSILSSYLTVSGSATAELNISTKLNTSLLYLDNPNYALLVTAHPEMNSPTESMNVDEDQLTQTFTVKKNKPTTSTMETQIAYTNYDSFTLTNGQASISHNCNSALSGNSSSLDNTILTNNSTGTVDTSLTFNTKNIATCQATITLTYEYSSTTKTFTYYIDIVK